MSNLENSPEIRDIINKTILQYPSIEKVIRKDQKFYELNFCRYNQLKCLKMKNPAAYNEMLEEIAEFTLAGVIYGSYLDSNGFFDLTIQGHTIPRKPFTPLLSNLDKWLTQYSAEYRRKSFGKKLKSEFFNHYSEIQFYDKLFVKGFRPVVPAPIGSNGKNLDFKIIMDSHEIFIELTTQFNAYETEVNLTVDDRKDAITKIKEIIAEKTCKQFQFVESDDICIILAVNIEYADMDLPLDFPENPLKYCPYFVYGLLLYRRGQGKFYINPRYSLTSDEIHFFENLFDELSPVERLLRAVAQSTR